MFHVTISTSILMPYYIFFVINSLQRFKMLISIITKLTIKF